MKILPFIHARATHPGRHFPRRSILFSEEKVQLQEDKTSGKKNSCDLFNCPYVWSYFFKVWVKNESCGHNF